MKFENAVVAAVGDVERRARGYRAPRVPQRTPRRRQGLRVGSEVHASRVQRPGGARRRGDLFDRSGHALDLELARLESDEYPLRRDERDGWPRVHRVRLPDTELPVVHDRVGHAEPVAGPSYGLGPALAGVLARVDADDHELAG